MEIHHELADLARSAGHQVFDEAEPFRAAVDDFLSSDTVTTGELNLLVDAVRLRGLVRLSEMLDRGAEPTAAIDAAADQLARDRGTTEVAGARWALAVLGYAVGRVGDAQVRACRDAMVAGRGPKPATAVALPPPAPPAAVTLAQLPQPAATAPPPPQVPAHHVPAPQNPFLPAPPPRRRRTGIVVALVALAVVVLAGGIGGVLLVVNALGGDDRATAEVPAAATTTPTSASTDDAGTGSALPDDDTQDPLSIGYPLHNLACDGQFIVVLTSAEGDSPAATAQDALDRFPRADSRAYLEPERSCSNLSHLTNKVNLSVVPYAGPYPDAVSACEARMATTDTTTYVIAVEGDATTATYCACSYDDAALPTLNGVDDADPVGDDRFWTLELQYMLWDAGYNPDKLVPGRFGEQTAAFVRELQGDTGIAVTGALDATTWGELKARACP